MKIVFLLGTIVTAINLQAQIEPTVNWVSDTYSSFDVILSGTGPAWSGTIFSPSGLWQLDMHNAFGLYSTSLPQFIVNVDNYGNATFLGQLPPQDPAPSQSDYNLGIYWNTVDVNLCTHDTYMIISRQLLQ